MPPHFLIALAILSVLTAFLSFVELCVQVLFSKKQMKGQKEIHVLVNSRMAAALQKIEELEKIVADQDYILGRWQEDHGYPPATATVPPVPPQ